MNLSSCGQALAVDEVQAQTPVERRATYTPQPQQTDVCQAFRDTSQTDMKTFWLGLKPRSEAQNFDYKFSIPLTYFNNLSSTTRSGRVDKSGGAILFHARYPDFAPYSRKFSEAYLDYGDWDKTKPNREFIGYEISMLWGGWASPGVLPTDWLEDEEIRFYFKRKDSSPEGWQIEERPSSITPDLLELDPDMQYDKGTTYKKYRMFIHRDSAGAATDQIFCYKENFGFGDCSHRFVYGQLRIKLRYESAYLKDWKQIKQNTQKFFDCALIEKSIRVTVEDK